MESGASRLPPHGESLQPIEQLREMKSLNVLKIVCARTDRSRNAVKIGANLHPSWIYDCLCIVERWVILEILQKRSLIDQSVQF